MARSRLSLLVPVFNLSEGVLAPVFAVVALLIDQSLSNEAVFLCEARELEVAECRS